MAQPVAAPKVVAGDSWTYQSTVENRKGWQQTRNESTVIRASASGILVSNNQVGSTMPPTEQLFGADWSRERSVNGHSTIVNQPLAFPLHIGKSWEVEYAEDNPTREHKSERRRTTYKVTGWEDVSVPAGTFHALKIEAEGDWSAVMAPTVGAVTGTRTDAQGTTAVVQTSRITPMIAAGRLYKAFWYVPEVKRCVKALEEYFDANNVRNQRFLDELMSFKVAN